MNKYTLMITPLLNTTQTLATVIYLGKLKKDLHLQYQSQGLGFVTGLGKAAPPLEIFLFKAQTQKVASFT